MHVHFPAMTGMTVLMSAQRSRGMAVRGMRLALRMIVRMDMLVRMTVAMHMAVLVGMLRTVLVGMGVAVLVTMRMLMLVLVLVVALHRSSPSG